MEPRGNTTVFGRGGSTITERSGLGQWGEDLAEKRLESAGWVILERNLETPVGECDLVGKDHPELVFVEVKTRRSTRFGPPQASVTADKRRRLRNVARYYLSRHDPTPASRFDVIAILLRGHRARFNHIQAAFPGRR